AHGTRLHRLTVGGEDEAQRPRGAGVAEQAERTDPQIEARHPSTSGRSVATAVRTASTPASPDADSTCTQSTLSRTAAVPIVATAVWAMVRTARTTAAAQKARENRTKCSGMMILTGGSKLHTGSTGLERVGDERRSYDKSSASRSGLMKSAHQTRNAHSARSSGR